MVRTRRGFIVGLTSAVALIVACKSSNDGSDVALDGGTQLPDGASEQDANAGASDAGGDAQGDGAVGTDASTNDAGGDPDDAASTDDASTGDAGGEDAASTDPMTLTSPAVVDGRLAKDYTCDVSNAPSPALSWTAGPAGTLSYAVVMTDLSIAAPNLHWIIYDVPANTTSLAAAIPKVYEPGAPAPAGSKQSKASWGPDYGYFHPCPPSGDHDYVFTVYALKNATLTGVTSTTPYADIQAAIVAQKVDAGAEASLHAKYKKQ